jgi:hypothetical protein
MEYIMLLEGLFYNLVKTFTIFSAPFLIASCFGIIRISFEITDCWFNKQVQQKIYLLKRYIDYENCVMSFLNKHNHIIHYISKKLYIDLFWFFIYCYGYLEISSIHLKEYVNSHICHWFNEERENVVFEFINNGNIVIKFFFTKSEMIFNFNKTKEYIFNGLKFLDPDLDYLIIFTNSDKTTFVIDKIENLERVKTPPEKVEFSFCFMQVFYNNTCYTIKLNHDKQNFNIVGNCIDSRFIKYYLTRFYKLSNKKDDDLFKYELTFLDENMKMKKITQEQTIQLNKTNYSIIG